MPHFFISTKDVNDNIITISDAANFHHLARVLRVKIGETLYLIDENGIKYKTEVIEISSHTITTKVVEKFKSNHSLGLQLYLAQSIIKTDAQNLLVQKATELGVKGIIPFLSDNSVIKEDVADSKIEKWQKIADEASKQCERADKPVIFKRQNLKAILENDEYKVKIACVERSQDMTLKDFLKKNSQLKKEKVLVIVGPEGGFSAEEIGMFEHYNLPKLGIGKLILRAETAVISALSNVIYEWEDE